jgi:hypothetical protein
VTAAKTPTEPKIATVPRIAVKRHHVAAESVGSRISYPDVASKGSGAHSRFRWCSDCRYSCAEAIRQKFGEMPTSV